jgi:hypothetical protein
VLDQAVAKIDGGVGLAAAGRHLDQGARAVAQESPQVNSKIIRSASLRHESLGSTIRLAISPVGARHGTSGTELGTSGTGHIRRAGLKVVTFRGFGC